MPNIRPAKGPEAGFELVRRHVSGEVEEPPPFDAVRPHLLDGKLMTVDSTEAARLINAELGPIVPISAALESTEPYAVYTASRKNLGNQFLRTARLTAWHYVLVEENDNVHSLVEVATIGEHQEALSYAGLYPRPYAEMMVQAIDAADALPQTASQQYELRVLRAPDLSLLAIWLRPLDVVAGAADEWSNDLIIPIEPGMPYFEAGTVMTPEQLIKVLQPIAALRQSVTRTAAGS
jgi:hypothetical protein